MTSLICWKSVSTAVLRGTIINDGYLLDSGDPKM